MSSFSAWLCLCFAHAYTVRSTESTPFPIQIAASTDSNTFLRIHRSGTEALKCPSGFFFSSQQMKCVVDTTNALKKTNYFLRSEDNVCPSDFRGTTPNPLSCRSFYNCWDGIGYEMACNDHLLYNKDKLQCDWPETAGCCEYWEKNSSLIVQSS